MLVIAYHVALIVSQPLYAPVLFNTMIMVILVAYAANILALLVLFPPNVIHAIHRTSANLHLFHHFAFALIDIMTPELNLVQRVTPLVFVVLLAALQVVLLAIQMHIEHWFQDLVFVKQDIIQPQQLFSYAQNAYTLV